MDPILKHFGVKVLAVVLAFLLWVHVVTNMTYDHRVELPLEIIDIPEGMMLVSNVDKNCDVMIRGTGKQLIRFLIDADDAKITAAGYGEGLYVIDITPEGLICDNKGATEIIEVISPKKVRLRIEERLEQWVSVSPNVEVTSALGYQKDGELKVTPDTVLVSGPKRVVRKMQNVKTEELTFTDIKEPFRDHVRLTFPDSSYLTLSDSSVLIEQNIIQLMERTFSDIPIGVRNKVPDSTYTIVPTSVSVTVMALPAVLDSLSAGQFAASIDVAGVPPGSTFVSPIITFPNGLHLIDVKPKEIRVEVPRE
ncbi:MAG: hypothetical protein KKG33_10135 [candidate division Zixibacteria bacterium]|nr:hypothetical protein [candidate division Zixibacteria bacterium]MBU1470456.1 hypothetical protein [candidate division Zixibacteria bacterium]MBU2625905.1 hypothetical protein [candidate division Zixibacteria bacterium]